MLPSQALPLVTVVFLSPLQEFSVISGHWECAPRLMKSLAVYWVLDKFSQFALYIFFPTAPPPLGPAHLQPLVSTSHLPLLSTICILFPSDFSLAFFFILFFFSLYNSSSPNDCISVVDYGNPEASWHKSATTKWLFKWLLPPWC